MRRSAVIVAAIVIVAAGVHLWSRKESPLIPDPTVSAASRTPAGIPAADHAEPPGSSDTTPIVAASSSESSRTSRDPPPRTPAEELTAAQEMKVRAYLHERVRAAYGDLAHELGLDSEVDDAVRQKVVEHLFRASQLDAVTSIDDAESHRDSRRALLQEVEALLGPDGARRFAEYHRTVNARHEVADMARVLREAGMPMNEETRIAIVRAAIANGAYIEEQDFSGGMSEQAWAQELVARAEIRDQRMLQSARGVLSAAQFELYRTHLEQRAATIAASMSP